MGKSNGAPNNASSQTKNYEITPYHSGVTEGSYHSSLFFHAFPGGLEKAAIKRKNMKFFFLSAGTRRLDLAVRRMLSINHLLLGLRPSQSLRAPPISEWDVSIYYLYLLTRNGSRFEKGSSSV